MAASEFNACATAGDPRCLTALARMYDGLTSGTVIDHEKAIMLWEKAAAQGLAEAQYMSGYLYYKGIYVRKNDREVAKWFRLATEQGHPGAQNDLVGMYRRGEGVRRDFAKAVEWYRKAAEQGFAEAQYNLGAAYANGHGVPKITKENRKAALMTGRKFVGAVEFTPISHRN